MAKETAEQKLLKMMQKTGSPVAVKASAQPKAMRFSFSIALLNRLLFVGVAVCVLGLFMEMRSGYFLLNQDLDLSDKVKVARSIADLALPSSRGVDFYIDQIKSRNIFKPFEAQVKPKSEGSINLSSRLSRYKLVGIAWLDLPETASVMIEDTQANATHFLKQGEQIDGVTVKTIYTDRAVFSYENEETTIKL